MPTPQRLPLSSITSIVGRAGCPPHKDCHSLLLLLLSGGQDAHPTKIATLFYYFYCRAGRMPTPQRLPLSSITSIVGRAGCSPHKDCHSLLLLLLSGGQDAHPTKIATLLWGGRLARQGSELIYTDLLSQALIANFQLKFPYDIKSRYQPISCPSMPLVIAIDGNDSLN
ncbi:hypothetical protein MiSe_63200 [Microseira wollei NIES-4236]|uniref:Uncharacterized protein n=1 Tax=Microseira wollei NIES-4236 TaxID=2530354 RepID=A0AAV3XGV7_9CYAN|nr:hypothetical protein MiSe_63200 [Microseira wollei NIES-4236]